MQNVAPELHIDRNAMMVALQQLDQMLLSTMQLEMKPGLCEIYRSIQATDVPNISLPGIMLRLMNCAKVAKPIEVPRRNTVSFNGINLDFGDK